VALLKPGEFSDYRGRRIALSSSQLAGIARRYDPARQAAYLRLGHESGGPARGRITALHWDGAHLSADVAGVDAALAAELAHGRWPGRSAELYAAPPDGGLYLRGVALLGADLPAVKGLPPWPAALPDAPDSGVSTVPQAGLSPRPRQLNTILHLKEATMPADTDKHDDTTARLMAENDRLAREVAELKRAEQERDVAWFLSELKDGGRLTPAMEAAGLREALLAANAEPVRVQLTDGRELDLSELLREVLKSLPALCPATAEMTPAAGTPAPATPAEQDIARALGLSPEELSAVKTGA
jgi:hypothetical protein